jgi:subtilisin family serine protease
MHSLELIWKLAGNKGESIRVAMLDTGIESAHPAFRDVEIVSGDLCSHTPGIDLDGHGTQCCGIILQVAPACTIMAGRTAVQSGSFTSDALLSGLFWARHNKADIVCVCTGERVNDPDVDEIISLLHDEGVVVVAAIGNKGPSTRYAGLFPARCARALAVGAADLDGTVTDFTEFAPDKEIICLPGDSFTAPTIGGKYLDTTGTSMSAAYMAGLLALLKKQRGREYREALNALRKTCEERKSPRGDYLLIDPVRMFSQVS